MSEIDQMTQQVILLGKDNFLSSISIFLIHMSW